MTTPNHAKAKELADVNFNAKRTSEHIYENPTGFSALAIDFSVAYLSLSKENARLKAALEFYSDTQNWISRHGKVGITPAWIDCGNVARKALEKA